MSKPDIYVLANGFDAVAVGVQFTPSLVSEIVLQDVCNGAFFPMVFAIEISLGHVDLYFVARLVRVARWLKHVLHRYSIFCVVSFLSISDSLQASIPNTQLSDKFA